MMQPSDSTPIDSGPDIVDRETWLAARRELLAREKEHTRRGDELTQQRMAMPWTAVDVEYTFDTEDGPATLRELFGDRSQLMIYHFMFGPDWTQGCPRCSSIADGFDHTSVHLAHHDVAFWAVSRAPLDKLLAYRERLGWSFPWASSAGSSFNFDFDVTFTEDTIADQQFNYSPLPDAMRDPANLPIERPGYSVFARRGDDVYRSYGAFARGVDAPWTMWQLLDRTPKGRNEGDMSWFRRRDSYPD